MYGGIKRGLLDVAPWTTKLQLVYLQVREKEVGEKRWNKRRMRREKKRVVYRSIVAAKSVEKKKKKNLQPLGRFELPTPGLQDQCSNH